MHSSSFFKQIKRSYFSQDWARNALSTAALVWLTTTTTSIVQAQPVVVPPDISAFVDAVNAADAARASISALNSGLIPQVDKPESEALKQNPDTIKPVAKQTTTPAAKLTTQPAANEVNLSAADSVHLTDMDTAHLADHDMSQVMDRVGDLNVVEVITGAQDILFEMFDAESDIQNASLIHPAALAYRIPTNHPRIEGKRAIAFNNSGFHHSGLYSGFHHSGLSDAAFRNASPSLSGPYEFNPVKGGLLEDIQDAGGDLTLDEALGIYDDAQIAQVPDVVHNFIDLPDLVAIPPQAFEGLPWNASLSQSTPISVWDEINASTDGKISLASNRVVEARLVSAQSSGAEGAGAVVSAKTNDMALEADISAIEAAVSSIAANAEPALAAQPAQAGLVAPATQVAQPVQAAQATQAADGVSEVEFEPRPAPSFFEAVPVMAQNFNQSTPQIAAYRTGDTARTEAAAKLASAMASKARINGANAQAKEAPTALSAAAQAGATGNALHMRLTQVQVTPDSGLAWDANGALSGLIGQEIDAHLLQRVINQLSRYYRDLGYTNAQAYLPEQSILDGKLDVYVATTKLQDVMLENKTAVNDDYFDYLLSGLKAQYGQPINQAEIESQLLKLSDLGVFNLVGGFSALDATGLYADLELQAEPSSDRWSFDVFADNYGNESSGRYRFGGQLIVRSPFGLADRLSVFYARTDEQQNNYSLNYEVPINSHPTVFGVNFCYSNYELGQEYAILGAQGHAYTIEGYVREPMFRDADNKVDLQVGMRYRKLVDEFRNFDLEFRKHTLAAYTSLSTVNALNVDTSVYGKAMFTLGRLYMDDAYELMPEDTFYLLNLDAGVMHRFSSDLFWQTSIQAQMASTALEGSEQFLAGGPLGISALGSSDLVGDSGLVLRNALIFQPFASTPDFTLNLGPHIEAASVSSKGYTSDSAASAGFQISLWSYGFNANLDFSTILGSKPEYAEDDSRILFSVSYTF